VELFGGCEVLCLLPNHQWPLLSMCMSSTPATVDCAASIDLNPSIGRVIRLPVRWPCSIILFDNIVQEFDPPHSNRGAIRIIVTLDGRGIGLAPIDGDCLRHAMPADRLGQEPLGRWLVACLRQEEINGLARFIASAIQIALLALDLDIGFIHAPANSHWSLPAVNCCFQLRTVLHDPPIDRLVVDGHLAFLHQFFDMAIA
jgi:hypothetical protein